MESYMRHICCRMALLASVLFGFSSCAAPPKADSAMADAAITDSAAGESCAAKLSPAASSVYRAAAPDMRRDADLASLLREKVIYMVLTDHLQRSAARPAAEQAAACLQLQQH